MPKMINQDQIYKSPPPAPPRSGIEISAEELESLIGMIVAVLGESLGQAFRAHLTVHIGDESTYKMKSEIRQELKVIYDRLLSSELTSSEKHLIFSKLYERAENCTPGFHDGVNAIIDGFFAAKNMDDLLFRVRQDIVARMATRLTEEVHTNNRCFIVAATDGYGVRALNPEDAYTGKLSDVKIQAELEKTFSAELTPLNLIRRLEEQLRGQLSGIGYVGAHAEGYPHQDVEKFDGQLQSLLSFSTEVARLKNTTQAIASARDQKEALFDEARGCLNDVSDNQQTQLLTFISGQDRLFSKKNARFFTQHPEIKAGFEDIKTRLQALEMGKLNKALASATEAYQQAFYLQANEDAPITDLNWPHLRNLLWQGIKQQGYFILEPNEESCLDTLMSNTIPLEAKQDAITQFFQLNPSLDDVLVLLNQITDLEVNQQGYLEKYPENKHSIELLNHIAEPSVKLAVLTKLSSILKNKPLEYQWIVLSGLQKNDIDSLINTGLFDDVNQANKDGHTVFHWAAAKGHTAIVEQLLKVPEINVNQADKDGRTALHWAAFKGHTAIVEQLTNRIYMKNFTPDMRQSAEVSALLESLRSMNHPVVITAFCKQFQDKFSNHIQTEKDLANLLAKLPPDLSRMTYQALQKYSPQQLKNCLTNSTDETLTEYIESLLLRERYGINFFSKYFKADLLRKLSAALWLQGVLAGNQGYDLKEYEQHQSALENGPIKQIFDGIRKTKSAWKDQLSGLKRTDNGDPNPNSRKRHR